MERTLAIHHSVLRAPATAREATDADRLSSRIRCVSCWNHGNAHFLRGVLRELIARGHDVRAFEPANGWSRAQSRWPITDAGRSAVRDDVSRNCRPVDYGPGLRSATRPSMARRW